MVAVSLKKKEKNTTHSVPTGNNINLQVRVLKIFILTFAEENPGEQLMNFPETSAIFLEILAAFPISSKAFSEDRHQDLAQEPTARLKGKAPTLKQLYILHLKMLFMVHQKKF